MAKRDRSRSSDPNHKRVRSSHRSRSPSPTRRTRSRYKHDQSSLEYVITVSKLGGRTLINGIANEVGAFHYASFISFNGDLQSERTASLDISTNDFVSPSFYPYDLSAANTSPLVHGFISSHRVSDLMSQFKLKIVAKLMPGLRKEGYSEQPEEVLPTSSSAQRPAPAPAPVRPEPEHPPFASDVHPGRLPLRNPLEIGRRDLDPVPLHPFQPPPLFPLHGGDDDGMFPGPGHPIFGGRRGPRADFDHHHGPWGGDGFLPPMGAPPGARFDPVGPNLGPRGPFGGGRGGSPRNLRGPDNDEFMPPGAVRTSFFSE